jgi:hypothetical protein
LVHPYIIHVYAGGQFAVIDGLAGPAAAYDMVKKDENGMVKFFGAIDFVEEYSLPYLVAVTANASFFNVTGARNY